MINLTTEKKKMLGWVGKFYIYTAINYIGYGY